jgi:site-specific DNA-methyltransferase (adenine-specific)
MASEVRLIQGECLSEMAKLPDQSVDMVMCDLPYGTTQNKWDTVIDLPEMWKQYKRLIRGGGNSVDIGATVHLGARHE